MRLQRFFVHEFFDQPLSELADGEVRITDKELIHQWKDVFRLKAADDVILLDNTGTEYLSNISELHKDGARLHIAEIRVSKNIPARNITLYASLIKKDNFEWILEKGTELGINTFVPILSERSEKKNLNMERARKILKEASEQSGRGIIPELQEIQELKEVFGAMGECIAFDPTGKRFEVSDVHEKDIRILIGPEGGWSERELEVFEAHRIQVYSLGSQVLRAETAAIAVSSLILL